MTRLCIRTIDLMTTIPATQRAAATNRLCGSTIAALQRGNDIPFDADSRKMRLAFDGGDIDPLIDQNVVRPYCITAGSTIICTHRENSRWNRFDTSMH